MSSSARLLERGRALYRKGAFASALRAFERYLDAHPRSAEGWLAVARALLRLGAADEALAACNCALVLVPNQRGALELRERITADRASVQAPVQRSLQLPPELIELVPALFELLGGL